MSVSIEVPFPFLLQLGDRLLVTALVLGEHPGEFSFGPHVKVLPLNVLGLDLAGALVDRRKDLGVVPLAGVTFLVGAVRGFLLEVPRFLVLVRRMLPPILEAMCIVYHVQQIQIHK